LVFLGIPQVAMGNQFIFTLLSVFLVFLG